MMNNKDPETPELTNEDKMARGSAWMTVGNIGSRLLGVIYLLPWIYWLGDDYLPANALFNMSYNIYALFLMISTAGLPSAIAKQVAYYNSINEYRASQKLFMRAMQLMLGLGAFFAVIMYFAAPALAENAGGGVDLIPSMRSLSVAILVIPLMSVIRGYFQGLQNVAPYAISQLVEQIARVLYLLIATFVIMRLGSGDYVSAVTQSTFAAFIGALASIAVLLYYYQKEKGRLDVLAEMSPGRVKVNTTRLLLQTIREAVPFIIVGSGITIYKLVDQYTFINVMERFTEYSNQQLQSLFALFSGNPDKLVMVVIALATSLATVGLPLVTEAFAKKDQPGLARLVSNNLQLYAFVMFPSTFGMMLLAYPLNTLFYQPNRLGASLLIAVSFSGLLLGLFMLTSSMLQGIYKNSSAVLYFAIGLVVKFLTQFLSIYMLESYGPVISTILGFGVTCYLNLRKLHKETRFNVGLTFRRIVLIFLLSMVMLAFAAITRGIFGMLFTQERKIQSFVLIIIVAAIGALVYLYMTLKIRLADKLLGSKMALLRRKLRIK
ncbi:putative polysaccharide biosynthesis protein [Tetragenococcus solitarius]|uniref:Polysaccharide biosynthesis protein n=1 Tax=Tetragenococcus solitarius TaxID=71453 RepID=A0ABN3Y9H0_9ENTE|nr:polysaccharide biosynthesis protein [Tetragenococcus solitarius]